MDQIFLSKIVPRQFLLNTKLVLKSRFEDKRRIGLFWGIKTAIGHQTYNIIRLAQILSHRLGSARPSKVSKMSKKPLRNFWNYTRDQIKKIFGLEANSSFL